MIAIYPELVQAAEAADVERLAVLSRRYFGGDAGRAPRIDALALARRSGLSVQRLPVEGKAAVVARDERGAFTVALVLDPSLDGEELAFTAAHQFGHVLLDILPVIARGDFTLSGYRETHMPLKRYAFGATLASLHPDDRREARADQFAAALLMPAGMVRRAYEKLADERRTAAFFGVTAACLARRLADLGARAAGPGSFLEAGATLGGGASELVAEATAVVAPLEAPAMPRGVAASSYGKTAAARRAPKADAPTTPANATGRRAPKLYADAPAAPAHTAAPAQPPSAPASAPPAENGNGMERLRRIARSLDKSVP